jgi:hypothetical protein
MNNMPKTNTVVKKHWWQFIKKLNLLILVIFLSGSIFSFYNLYTKWANSITSPTEHTEFAFTVSPGGGGKGDRLTSTPVEKRLFSRIGQENTYVNLHFGPWDKAVKINKIEVHPLIQVRKDTTVNVTLNLTNGRDFDIGSFFAKGIYTTQIDTDTFAIVGSEKHLSKSFDDLLVPAGVSGTINLIVQGIPSVNIDTDTYIWFDLLQARSAPVDSWWGAMISNPLSIALLIAVIPIFVKEFVYETESERRQKEQIVILKEIEKHLGERNKELPPKPEVKGINRTKHHK